MFACIYFIEDASLSVVNVKDKNLNWQEEDGIQIEPNPRSKVTMKWGRTMYNGTVIKLHDDEEALLSFATKADAKLKRNYQEKPTKVPEELFGFDLEKENNKNETQTKRNRTPTERFKESKKQDEEISPKKKKRDMKSDGSKDQEKDNEQKTESSAKKKKKHLEAGSKHDSQKKCPAKEKNEKKKSESAASLASSIIMCDLMSQVAKHSLPESHKESQETPPSPMQNVTKNPLEDQIKEDVSIKGTNYKTEVSREHKLPASPEKSIQIVDVTSLQHKGAQGKASNIELNSNVGVSPAPHVNSTNLNTQYQPQGNLKHSTPKADSMYYNQGFNIYQDLSMPMSSQSTNFSFHRENHSRHTSYPLDTESETSSTSMLETWDLVSNCTGDRNFANSSSHHNTEGSRHPFIQSVIPAPTSEVLVAIRGFLKPEVQVYLRSVVDHFDQQGQYEYMHHKEPEEEQYFESSASEDDGGTFMDISPLQRQPRKKLIYKDLNRTDETENDSYSKDVTPLRRSPRKLENKTLEGNKNGPGNTELLLKSFPSVHVKPEVVRTATAAARRSNKPGYTLCYKLLLGVFSEETIANSRGQGINKPKEGETRPPLNKEQVEAIKEFSIKWCKKNEKPVPLMSELNNAITEQVSHCRKILKKKLSKK